VGFEVLTAVTLLATCFNSGFLSAYSLIMKMEAMPSSEKSVEFQRITQRYIPEDSTLHTIRFSRWALLHEID
jgi:hypothetical protein